MSLISLNKKTSQNRNWNAYGGLLQIELLLKQCIYVRILNENYMYATRTKLKYFLIMFRNIDHDDQRSTFRSFCWIHNFQCERGIFVDTKMQRTFCGQSLKDRYVCSVLLVPIWYLLIVHVYKHLVCLFRFYARLS